MVGKHRYYSAMNDVTSLKTKRLCWIPATSATFFIRKDLWVCGSRFWARVTYIHVPFVTFCLDASKIRSVFPKVVMSLIECMFIRPYKRRVKSAVTSSGSGGVVTAPSYVASGVGTYLSFQRCKTFFFFQYQLKLLLFLIFFLLIFE